MKLYRAYDLQGNVVTEGTSKEVKISIGMKLGSSITQYAFGRDTFKGKYMVLEADDPRDVMELIKNRRGKKDVTDGCKGAD